MDQIFGKKSNSQMIFTSKIMVRHDRNIVYFQLFNQGARLTNAVLDEFGISLLFLVPKVGFELT